MSKEHNLEPSRQTYSHKVKRFLKKYFWEGQKLDEKVQVVIPENATWSEKILIKHRRIIGILIPVLFCQTIYWSLAIRYELWKLFPDRYLLSITMIFGALVAGATSEGGGAVAFPVMTLALKASPRVAADVAMMLQTCGMSAASFCIFWMKIKLEKHSLIFCSIGGTLGLTIGLEFVAPKIPAAWKKMLFVSVWFAFAGALFILNRRKKRKTFDSIPKFNWWKALVLIGIGYIGGTFTAIAGSGVDICSFSILTLLFQISEKVATPTSVILMASNSAVGFYWRQFMQSGISQEAWEWLAVVAPIVTINAPFGSLIASHFHRQVFAVMIYVLETIALITAYVIIRPGVKLACFSAGTIIGMVLLFFGLSKLGEYLMMKYWHQERILLPQISITSQCSVDAESDGNHKNGSTEMNGTSGMHTAPTVISLDDY